MEHASSVEPVFECGPLRWLKTRLGLFPLASRGALRAAFITWVPMLILSVVDGARTRWESLRNVYQMKMTPVDLGSVLYLAVASLLPFVPVLLASVPLDHVLETAAQLFF